MTSANHQITVAFTQGAVAMTDEAFRAEIEKPVAMIPVNMALFRGNGGHQLKLTSFYHDEVDPQEQYETLRDSILELAAALKYEIDGDADECSLCVDFMKVATTFVKEDVDLLIEHAATLSVAIREDDREFATQHWNSLPEHLQEAITKAEDIAERAYAENTPDAEGAEHD